jgi:hypothetical protein
MKPAYVNATQLARHLGLSRQFVNRLADDRIIERHADGFDQDQSRLRYMAWLRDPQRRSAKAEADAQLRRLKAEALELKIAREAGELMVYAEHCEIIDEICALVRWELEALPARLSRDIIERRRIELAINETLNRLADQLEERAKAAETQGSCVHRG